MLLICAGPDACGFVTENGLQKAISFVCYSDENDL